jgi:hypothetical protein
MAMASVYQVARNLFEYANGNTERTAAIALAFDQAASGLTIKGETDEITSAAKNAVSMTKRVGLAENDRITALRYAKNWLAAGMAPSSRARVRF